MVQILQGEGDQQYQGQKMSEMRFKRAALLAIKR